MGSKSVLYIMIMWLSSCKTIVRLFSVTYKGPKHGFMLLSKLSIVNCAGSVDVLSVLLPLKMTLCKPFY